MKKSIIFLVALSLLATGCTISLGGNQSANSKAGVYKSADKGETWVEKNLFLHSQGAGSISNVNVLNLMFDPTDNRSLYLTAETAGLLFSYDSADSWQKAKPVGDGRINSAAVDPKDKCTLYATYANTILKSTDCSRSWTEAYIDSRGDKIMTALATDGYNQGVIYAANSGGDVFKSTDSGATWQVIYRLKDAIAKMLILPQDTRVIYLATKTKGLYKSADSGATWQQLNDGLTQYSGALEFRNLLINEGEANSLILVCKYGLLKTVDGGTVWDPIKLITPPASVDIFGVAVNPKDSKEIYYSTKTTFYKTTDGGATWVTKRLPTSATAVSILVDSVNPNIVYLGLANLVQK